MITESCEELGIAHAMKMSDIVWKDIMFDM